MNNMSMHFAHSGAGSISGKRIPAGTRIIGFSGTFGNSGNYADIGMLDRKESSFDQHEDSIFRITPTAFYVFFPEPWIPQQDLQVLSIAAAASENNVTVWVAKPK